MKYSAIFACAAVTADNSYQTSWPGQVWDADQGTYTNCGTNAFVAGGSINGTCTIKFDKPTRHVSIPGCFSAGQTKDFECNGVEGVTRGEGFDVTVFWDQTLDGNGKLDNSTCGTFDDIEISCVDNGYEPQTAMLDNISNNFHADNAGAAQTNKIQIFGARGTDAYTVSFADNFGDAVSLTNATCDWFCSSFDDSRKDEGILTFHVNKDSTDIQLFELNISYEGNGPDQRNSFIESN